MRKIVFILLILIIFSFLLSYSYDAPFFSNEIYTKEKINVREYGNISIYFCPLDDCEKILVNEIKKAERIDCAFYDLNLESVEDSLRGKNYRIILDNKNKDKVELINLRSDNRKELMHNKFCIFDSKKVLTGSMNPTFNGAHRNNNNLVLIESIALAMNYEDEFEEMWEGEYGGGDRVYEPKIYYNEFIIENYFCPEDECEKQIINLLRQARNRIYFMVFSFTSDKISEEIIRNFHYGIDVKGIFEKSQIFSRYSEYDKLRDIGINVKVDKNPKAMHHKVFIIDDVVVLGSYNPTKSGNKYNDENILIIHSEKIARKFIEEFNRLYM